MSLLLTLATQAGLPILKSILSRKLGDAGGRLAGDLIESIAIQAGADDAAALEKMAGEDPARVTVAMRQVEDSAPEGLLAVWQTETEGRIALLMAEQEEGGWKAAWRPALMWFNIFLWAWQAVILHVANAVWKIALPPMPWDQLLSFSGLTMGLYMGGHTVKDLAAKWAAK